MKVVRCVCVCLCVCVFVCVCLCVCVCVVCVCVSFEPVSDTLLHVCVKSHMRAIDNRGHLSR